MAHLLCGGCVFLLAKKEGFCRFTVPARRRSNPDFKKNSRLEESFVKIKYVFQNGEEIDVLKERNLQAVEYMAWFVPAWEELTKDERYVLQTFYGEDNQYGTSAIYNICDHFGIERSSAYNRKNCALSHLVTLLFGKA